MINSRGGKQQDKRNIDTLREINFVILREWSETSERHASLCINRQSSVRKVGTKRG